MISANQILAHLVGDYILQSDWMMSTSKWRHIACSLRDPIRAICVCAGTAESSTVSHQMTDHAA